MDEDIREYLTSIPKRRWDHMKIIDILADLMLTRGIPSYIRSDNGTEFTAAKLREWLSEIYVASAYIEPGSPWEMNF